MIRRHLPLYLVIFLGYVGYSMTLPLFTAMMLNPSDQAIYPEMSMGMRSVILGLLLFLYPAGQFFGAPILGALSDHFGRKRMLLCSLAATTLLYGVIAFSLWFNVPLLLMISLFVAGFSEGNIAIAQSAMADMVHGHERTVAFGWIYASASIAYIVGPLLAGQLSDPDYASWFSYWTPFASVLLFLIPTIVWLSLGMQETRPQARTQKIDYLKVFSNVRIVVTHKQLRGYFAVAILLYLSVFGYYAGLPIFVVDRFHVDASALSLLIAYVAAIIFVTNIFVVPRLPRHWKMLDLTAISGVLAGLFMMALVVPRSVNLLWATLIPVSIAVGLSQTACSSMISHRASPDEQGQVLGANQSLLAAAEAISAAAAGALTAILIPLPLILFGILGILGGAVLLGVARSETRLQ
jgi:MFS family permease